MVHPGVRLGNRPRRSGDGGLLFALARSGVSRRPEWIVVASVVLAAAFLLVSACGRFLWAEDAANPSALPSAASPTGAEDSRASAQEPGPMRLREGTTLRGLVGSIRPVGDRWTLFLSQRDERYILLENLALERILRTNASFTESPDWTVDGTVTEFRGQNYLLIEKALIGKVTAPPSAQ
ncbi:hypothetical protein [Thermopirellula anaerolimosa]